MNDILKMTDAEYFSSNGLSNSYLKLFDRSPLHANTEREVTESMSIGIMIHTFILQPELFNDLYLVSDLDGRTKEGKQLREVNPDKQIIKSDVMADLMIIRDRLYNMTFEGRSMKEIIEVSSKEITSFWTKDNLQFKSKMDLYYNAYGQNIIFDLKSCNDARADRFKWDIKNYGYDRQADFYIDGINHHTENPCRFIFIAIESKSPFGIAFHELSSRDLLNAKQKNKDTIEKYIDWTLFGADINQGYSNEVNIINLAGGYE
jgi:hypothetical protein